MMHAPESQPCADESLAELYQRREIWNNKYAIRACYHRWVNWMHAACRPGLTLEVGAGAGLIKEIWPDRLITTDIQSTPWIDFAADATQMGIGSAALDNVICIDALHHFAEPHQFLAEAARIVKPGGRLIMVEPWITPVSRIFYGAMHHEPICFTSYQDPQFSADDPWVGNLALANIVLGKEIEEGKFQESGWNPVQKRLFGTLDFQISGGFKPWSLAPWPPLFDFCMKVEDAFRFTAPMTGFRIFFVAEKL